MLSLMDEMLRSAHTKRVHKPDNTNGVPYMLIVCFAVLKKEHISCGHAL